MHTLTTFLSCCLQRKAYLSYVLETSTIRVWIHMFNVWFLLQYDLQQHKTPWRVGRSLESCALVHILNQAIFRTISQMCNQSSKVLSRRLKWTFCLQRSLFFDELLVFFCYLSSCASSHLSDTLCKKLEVSSTKR